MQSVKITRIVNAMTRSIAGQKKKATVCQRQLLGWTRVSRSSRTPESRVKVPERIQEGIRARSPTRE
jgi:hypothetical protein